MRTTIRLRAALLKRAKRRAAAESRTLTSIVEEGVSLVLAAPTRKRRGRVPIPVSQASGGVQPGVDLNRSSDLETTMEDA
jgi:hypothetical protein